MDHVFCNAPPQYDPRRSEDQVTRSRFVPVTLLSRSPHLQVEKVRTLLTGAAWIFTTSSIPSTGSPYLLDVVFVCDNGSVVEKRMIEGVWKQPTELHNSTMVWWAPAVLQAEADESKSTDSNAEEQQIVLLLGLVPASLWNSVRRPIIFNTSLGLHV